MAGGKVAVEAGTVTHGAVRCSAWLGAVRCMELIAKKSGNLCYPLRPNLRENLVREKDALGELCVSREHIVNNAGRIYALLQVCGVIENHDVKVAISLAAAEGEKHGVVSRARNTSAFLNRAVDLGGTTVVELLLHWAMLVFGSSL